MLTAATAVSFVFFQLGNKNVANITVIYVLALILTAWRTDGYRYGIISAFFCVIAVNYFFPIRTSSLTSSWTDIR